jgi:Flp pilus assembly protein TadD
MGRSLAPWLLIAAASLAVYARTPDFGFVGFDDGTYVTDAGPLREGLSAEGISWALGARHGVTWQPVTWLSHMLDFELFGDAPAGHHATNALLHALNALLVFGLLRTLTRQEGPSALVAALFAVHPLNVEVVAWVSERKELLSTAFGLLSIRAWLGFARDGRRSGYALAAVLFALALLAKPMLVTLPCLLLLLDHWPLGRLSSFREARARVVEKLPLFALAASASAVTLMVQRGAMAAGHSVPLPLRLANAGTAYVAYLRKAVWPSPLGVHYPHPYIPGTGGEPPGAWAVAACVTLLVAITALALLSRRGWARVGWLWFLGALVPVIGLVQVGTQALADRYAYVPLLGIFILVTWGSRELAARQTVFPRHAATAAAVALVAISGAVASAQSRFWRDSISLFEHALEVTPRNSTVNVNLGRAYESSGRLDEAADRYREALAVNPSLAVASFNLGNVLRAQGDLDGAVRHYRRALALRPDDALTANNLGGALHVQGRLAEAVPYYRRALATRPDHAGARANLTLALRALAEK